MTNPTLERAARAVCDAGLEWTPGKGPTWAETIARAVLMAVLPTLERYSVGIDWAAPELEQADEGAYVLYADLQAILDDGEGE